MEEMEEMEEMRFRLHVSKLAEYTLNDECEKSSWFRDT